MKVDRAGFLFFTSALLSACGTKQEGPNAPGAVTIPPQPPLPAQATGPAKAREPSPADAGGQGDLAVASSDEDDEEEAPYQPWPGTANPPLARTVHAQTCDLADNARGQPAGCALKPGPGPTCESFGATRVDCAKLTRWLVPRVAAKAQACLAGKSGKSDICLFNVGPSCVIQALSSVCLDPSPKIETACENVMMRCRKVDARHRHMTSEACKAAMSAIVPARRAPFLSCAAESCDLVPCIYAAQR